MGNIKDALTLKKLDNKGIKKAEGAYIHQGEIFSSRNPQHNYRYEEHNKRNDFDCLPQVFASRD